MITQTDAYRIIETHRDSLSKHEREHQSVLCKLAAEGLSIFSDWPDIEAVLSKTMAPTNCIRSAHQMRGNPYSPRREAAEQALKRVLAEQKSFGESTTPRTFIKGRSGVTEAYRRKLNAQLNRTIDLTANVGRIKVCRVGGRALIASDFIRTRRNQ